MPVIIGQEGHGTEWDVDAVICSLISDLHRPGPIIFLFSRLIRLMSCHDALEHKVNILKI